jgi:DNA polymerase
MDGSLATLEQLQAAAHVDTEGWGSLNLTEVGVHKWVEQDYVGMWCFAWKLPGMPEPVKWEVGDPDPQPLLYHIASGGTFAAHNAPFDRHFWNRVIRRYRPWWPEIKIEQCDCTVARVAAISVPGRIEYAAKVLGIADNQKEDEGSRLVKKYATAAYDKNGYRIWPTASEIQTIISYNIKDVVLEDGIAALAPHLSDRERQVWLLDQHINDRGFAIDIPLVKRLADVVDLTRSRITNRLLELTGGLISSHAQHARIAAWARSRGIPCTSTAKQQIPEIIAACQAIDISQYGDVVEVLDLKRQGGKSSVDKLFKMLECVCADGRLRGQLQYHGASTGRWAGRLTQPHNFYRVDPEKDGDDIEKVLAIVMRYASAEDALSEIEKLFSEHETKARLNYVEGAPRKSAMDMAAKCIRSTIIAAPGMKLVGGDKSNIEGRINAWIHDEDWKVEEYRKQDRKEIRDTYISSYAATFGADTASVTGPQRQVGKVCIAEGQMVLTNAGYVPIERVEKSHLLWDGDTWVRHDGLIFQGVKDVFEYDGVTATSDHEVYVEEFARPIPLAIAAEGGFRLRRTGLGDCRKTKKLARYRGKVRVYDLINAGLRHRFTVNDRIVSNCELSLGYQGSVGAFINMGATYGVKPADIARVVTAVKYSTPEWHEAEKQHAFSLKLKREMFGLSPVEWISLKIVVNGWRGAHAKITQGWWDLQDAAADAVANPGVAFRCCRNRVVYYVDRGILWCMLPSMRLLAYCNPRIIRVRGTKLITIDQEGNEVDEDDSTEESMEKERSQVAYDGFSSQSKQWGFKTLYGGKQCENVVSGLARDCLVEDMFRAEALGYRTVLTVHDEILCENYPSIGSREELRAIMNQGYSFAPGLPLEAKTWEGTRYEK